MSIVIGAKRAGLLSNLVSLSLYAKKYSWIWLAVYQNHRFSVLEVAKRLALGKEYYCLKVNLSRRSSTCSALRNYFMLIIFFILNHK